MLMLITVYSNYSFIHFQTLTECHLTQGIIPDTKDNNGVNGSSFSQRGRSHKDLTQT